MHLHAAIPQPHDRAPTPYADIPHSASIDLRLDWIGAPGQTSCPLETVWRDRSLTQGIAGVYVIWSRRGGNPVIHYLGNGSDIGAMLATHHDDARIAALTFAGDLVVSWAAVASIYRPGVVRYLAAALAPRIAEAVPAARAVSVNLPV